jgi:hypothetical protein
MRLIRLFLACLLFPFPFLCLSLMTTAILGSAYALLVRTK